MRISETTRLTCGLLLLIVPLIEYGGVVLLRSVVLRKGSRGFGHTRRELRQAGHAHAGGLLLLALVCQLLLDAANLPAGVSWLVRTGVAGGAVLVPLGPLMSSGAPPGEQPEPAMQLVFLGDILLAVSVVVLGAGLLGVLPAASIGPMSGM